MALNNHAFGVDTQWNVKSKSIGIYDNWKPFKLRVVEAAIKKCKAIIDYIQTFRRGKNNELIPLEKTVEDILDSARLSLTKLRLLQIIMSHVEYSNATRLDVEYYYDELNNIVKFSKLIITTLDPALPENQICKYAQSDEDTDIIEGIIGYDNMFLLYLNNVRVIDYASVK